MLFRLKTLTIFIVIVSIIPFFSCNETQKPNFDSRQAIEKVLSDEPLNDEALFARAKWHVKNSQADSALIDVLHAIEQDSSKAEYFIFLGDIYLTQNQTRYTRQALERAIAIDKDSQEAHMKLAELYLYVEMRQEAINEINEVLKRDKNNPKAYYLKGIIYKESGDTSLAISSFLTAKEQDPDYLLAYEQLGLVFAASKNPRAVDFYTTALKLNPNNSLTRYNLGMYYQSTNQVEKAIEVYNLLVEKDPAFANAHYNLGYLAIEEENNYDVALEHFKSAEIANPTFAAAIYMQGVCLENKNNLKDARTMFERALQVDRRFVLAKEGLNRIGYSAK
jgi:tetratricopeptide (TPR) repeat protein